MIEVFVAGDILGQLPFFDETPTRLTDAVAGRAIECLASPRTAVLDLLRSNARVAAQLLAVYSLVVAATLTTMEAAAPPASLEAAAEESP